MNTPKHPNALPALIVGTLCAMTAHATPPERAVVTWGASNFDYDRPMDVDAFDQLAIGRDACMARRIDGTIRGWGWDGDGLNGPAQNVQGVVQLTMGEVHAAALLQNGSIVAWGVNSDGQLDVPAGLHDVVQISSRGSNTAALNLDGQVSIWGANWSGALGNQCAVPAGLTGVTQISLGWYHSLARKADGTVVSWGATNAGQSIVPEGLSNVTHVEGGGSFSLAVRSDGTVIAWGNNYNGQCTGTDVNGFSLGGSMIEGYSQVHVLGQPLTGVAQVAAGWTHAMALLNDGTVVGWGSNNIGERTPPPAMRDVSLLAAGNVGTVALGVLCNGVCDPRSVCFDPTQCDRDSDGSPAGEDCDDNDWRRRPGRVELCDGIDNDCNGLVDDACREDCDHDGVPDDTQIANAPFYDLDQNGRIDFCEIRDDPSLDCNHNNYLDRFELMYPEYFWVTDCDHNGQIDACQVQSDPSTDCNGNGTFDACEILSGNTEDCDHDGVPDSCQEFGVVHADSPRLSPIGYTRPQTWTLENEVPALDSPHATVDLTVSFRGDFSSTSEYITVYLNGRYAGSVQQSSPFDCNTLPATRTLHIPTNVWNYALAAGNGTLAIEFAPSIAVDANLCPATRPSYVEATVDYISALEADCNQNGLLDACEVVDFGWVDMNHNGVPDECDGSQARGSGCPGDIDLSGEVDLGDVSLILLEMNSPAAPGDPLDIDASGFIDSGDVGLMLLMYGPCSG